MRNYVEAQYTPHVPPGDFVCAAAMKGLSCGVYFPQCAQRHASQPPSPARQHPLDRTGRPLSTDCQVRRRRARRACARRRVRRFLPRTQAPQLPRSVPHRTTHAYCTQWASLWSGVERIECGDRRLLLRCTRPPAGGGACVRVCVCVCVCARTSRRRAHRAGSPTRRAAQKARARPKTVARRRCCKAARAAP